MKKIVTPLLLLIFAVSFWNCEKDDICAEGTVTTPRLVIEFYDVASPTTLKNVTNLRVEESGTGIGVVFNTALAETDANRYLINSNKIEIPLKTFADQSQFDFKLNYGDTTNEVNDIITIDYSREDIYISRACGYKTNFTLSNFNFETNWISNATIEQTNVINENEVHVKIYF
ncbi:DUF6452 family protein [Flavobacterium okayamense]|uniref:Lipoprotein n=1 Tax=Flavobacterium okayamense TaxID=2830782 RepID=A0ABM7S7S5_9FLAO|nr:DUF6452 family protein [Flavobacterium okayamense]BCY29535.1 hypothetical protein KK2020170_24030 [Flavobacterium okayamense]